MALSAESSVPRPHLDVVTQQVEPREPAAGRGGLRWPFHGVLQRTEKVFLPHPHISPSLLSAKGLFRRQSATRQKKTSLTPLISRFTRAAKQRVAQAHRRVPPAEGIPHPATRERGRLN